MKKSELKAINEKKNLGIQSKNTFLIKKNIIRF